ncbi:MAG: glycosyltransferase [Chitinophagaceae bacterium]
MSPSIQTHSHQKKIIIAMMDWGLGHTTRCIPLIRQLQSLQCCITIAANTQQRSILERELHDIEYLELEGYQINYSQKGHSFFLKLFSQLPKFLLKIRQEQQWLQQLQHSHHFQAVISDNRYGFYLKGIPSVFITHQLSPISGKGKWLDIFIRFVHYKMIRNFQEIWIPDFEGSPNLAGKLSHPKKLPGNAFYIGPQTRFVDSVVDNTSRVYKVLAILSGPEPQRTILENILLQQMKSVEGKCILIRGLPNGEIMNVQPANIEIFQHLDTNQFMQYLNQSEIVICRSGYSSIMDLICLKKKAILVPTPGQTEQEYIAKEMQEKKIYPFVNQENFDINHALQIAEDFPYDFPPVNVQVSSLVIDSFCKSIESK